MISCVTDTDTKYAIWFRHTLEPDIDSISVDPHPTIYTYDGLRSATTGLDITHMYFSGVDLPPGLENIAPHLKHLQLGYIHSTDQLER